MHTLDREQIVQTTLEDAWDFIQNPYNLNLITPRDMEFTIVNDVPVEMENGLLIEYRVKIPLLGRQKWLTEIKHIQPGKSFVDEQRIGPYRFWYHHHEIQAVDEGVRFIDRVTYQVPFGLLGELVNALFIRRTLERIFNHRREMFTTLLTQ
jgi:ligand-binding SRPBCC domain-containing protein